MLKPQQAIRIDNGLESTSKHTGYRALFAAVVLAALGDALGYGRADGVNKALMASRAQCWINNPETGFGSFAWYCSWLDIDPALVRKIVQDKQSAAYLRMANELKSKQGVCIGIAHARKAA